MIKALYLLEHEDLLVLVHVDVFCVWQKPAWIIQRFSTINYSLQYITNEQSQWCQMQNKSEGARIIRNLDKQKKKKRVLVMIMSNIAKKVCRGGGGLKQCLWIGNSRSKETYWRMMVPPSPPLVHCPPHLKCYILSDIIAGNPVREARQSVGFRRWSDIGTSIIINIFYT